MTGLRLELDPATLRPLVQEVAEALARRLGEARAAVGDKLCFTEAEAARLLRINEHCLRDERRRGRIGASQIVGRRVRYTQQDLIDYLLSRRVAPGEES